MGGDAFETEKYKKGAVPYPAGRGFCRGLSYKHRLRNRFGQRGNGLHRQIQGVRRMACGAWRMEGEGLSFRAVNEACAALEDDSSQWFH